MGERFITIEDILEGNLTPEEELAIYGKTSSEREREQAQKQHKPKLKTSPKPKARPRPKPGPNRYRITLYLKSGKEVSYQVNLTPDSVEKYLTRLAGRMQHRPLSLGKGEARLIILPGSVEAVTARPIK